MMGTKVWIALCALLLINSGSATHDGDHAADSAAPTNASGGEVAPAAESVPGSPADPITSTTPSKPSSRGNNTTTNVDTISVTPDPKGVNDTKINSPSEAALPETTDQSTVQPSVPPSESHALATDTPLAATTASPAHTTQPTTVDTPTTTPPTTHPAALPPDSVTPSNQPTHNETHSSTPVPMSVPPKPETTRTVVAQSSSTSSTNSSQKPPNSELPTLTPQHTSQSDGHPETSSEAHLKSTINPPGSPSAQANARADTPSQLNVGGDPTMVHDSPTLDPLLAGLVSAFIITAVIITLLLFLKLRQRDNRPEFRRLQDLPMDDMMEDTPLSMYSY